MQSNPQTIYKNPNAEKPSRGWSRTVRLPRNPFRRQAPPPQPPPEIVSEVHQETVKQEVRLKEKIKDLTKVSHTVLYSCTTVFPFDIFPDELSIDATSVNIKKSSFFYTDQISSVPIKNISDVIVNTVPFFATITVIDQFFAQNTFKVSFIKKHEAEKARSIIQGLVILNKEGIDVSLISPEELAKRAEELGRLKSIETP